MKTGGNRAADQEIDVCENDSVNHTLFKVNVHTYNPTHRSLGQIGINSPDLSDGYHIWGCEFTPRQVTFFFDGARVAGKDVSMIGHGDENIWLTSIAASDGNTKMVNEATLPAVASFDYVRFFKESE